MVIVDDIERLPKPLIHSYGQYSLDLSLPRIFIREHRRCFDISLLSWTSVDRSRMKPQYPEEVLCDVETAEKVSRRWHEYFPKGMAMGDSDIAHVC